MAGFFLARRISSHICTAKVDASGVQLLKNRAESTGNCIRGHKSDAIPSWTTISLQTDHKPLKYLFAPDEEIPKTASARIAKLEIDLMGFDYDLKYTPGEQIHQAEALSRMDFDKDESDNDRVCFASITSTSLRVIW